MSLVEADPIAEDESVVILDPQDDPELKAVLAEAAGTRSKLESEIAEYIACPYENKTRIDKLARVMFNDARVRKICRLRALKNGVDIEEADDVLQRTMEVFFSKMLKKMVSHDAVYAVVYSIANNVSKEVTREAYSLITGHDSIDAMRENGEDLRVSDIAGREEQDQEALVDTRIVKDKQSLAFARVLQGVGILENTGVYDPKKDVVPLFGFVQPKAPGTEPVLPPLPDLTAAKAAKSGKKGKADDADQKQRELSPDQKELVDIIAKLEIRNQDFAVLLGIGLPRLSSYIYGRTASVPQDVMERAREILTEQSKANAELRQRFSGTMAEILVGWEQALGTETNEEIANYLGVTTMTIHRWRTNETRPDLTALVRYNTMVEQIKLRLDRANTQLNKKS
jgi:hypothetical protein